LEHDDFLHWKLYNEILHIPLIVRVPNIKQKIVNDNVGLIDLAPSILNFLNIDSFSQFQGKTFVPLIKNKDSNNRTILSESVQHYRQSIIKDDWKYIKKENDYELYNLEYDFYEQENLIKEYPKKIERMEKLLNKFLEKIHTG
jgi:arylsulfatase A-like enzyme